MKNRQIVNIINFIQGCEPREPVDLHTPVREQIALMARYGLRGTFLIQYDALIDPAYTDMLKALDHKQFEIGVWFEVVQPLVERVGLPWRGRFPWDWHVHCGFSMGYTKQERELLLDELYRKFREVFGYYPRVFGCIRNEAVYEFLPLVDGNIHSGNGIIADRDFTLENRVGKTDRHFPALVFCRESELRLRYSGLEYGIELTTGHFEDACRIRSENATVKLHFI